MIKIIINPIIDVQYATFYINGLQSVFGKQNVTFANKSELNLFILQQKVLNMSFLVINPEVSQIIKVSIDHGDFNTILDSETYKWADVYGKVNTNWTLTPLAKYPKIVCMASNFGVRGFNLYESIYYSLINFIVLKPKNIKRYFAQFYKQKNKLWIDQYPLSKAQNNYVFSVNTLWYNDKENNLNATTNKVRANFMETCLSMPDIVFEGGFVPSQLGNDSFKHLHLKQPLTQFEYISKLQKSVLAFNTPAVWNCHGWKLGEYLCMGKAIISTPLSNDLPAPLIHGESIHIVQNQQELIDAINLLNRDSEYRNKLEYGAREYFKKYVSPDASIKLLGII
jgi:glycosyltransferase involved in cell wall biosynthesis